MTFVHLRVHSEYSFLRGVCRLEALVERARELGMPAVALTDYGVLHGAVRFTELALRQGIRPVLGAEFALAGHLPLVLLVRDRKGWENLLRLVNRYQLAQPRPEMLAAEEIAPFAEGLSAVLHGGSATVETVENTIDKLGPCFGAELFLAAEERGAADASRHNRMLAGLARRRQIPLVATHNVHYVLPGDDPAYRMANCIRTGRPLAGSGQAFLPGGGYHLREAADMVRRFAAFPAACENTLRLAERCTFILERDGMKLPHFPLPGHETPEQALYRLCEGGLSRRGLCGAAVRARVERELNVILSKGLAAYFLIVHDLVRHARAEGIPVGPGRGSAGGSLVAYLLGITQVDPLAHGLYFERFLSEDRAEFPDIDLDVCQRRRDELLVYLRTRYGDGRVAQVSAFSTLGARAAVREAGKILDVAGEKVAAVAEALPHYSGAGGIDAAVSQFPEFHTSRLSNDAARALLDGARCLEGLCRHLTTHASGVILGVTDLAGAAPLCRGPAGEILTQWDKDDVEAMGFLKIDVLGSRNLTIIHDTLASVRLRKGTAPAAEEIPQDDEETYEMLRGGESLGCFQLESAGMRRILRRLAPERLEDLVHLLSLYRPGPWESGMVESFVARRHGREENRSEHPALAGILADTYGLVLYQEQVMRIACERAGYTPGEADRLRRDTARRSPSLEAYHRPKFTAGAVQNGLSEKEADSVFDYLCRFAGYSFNKAHSAAYALVSYWTAYLKKHYPVEFYAALLSTGFGYYGPAVYVNEARTRGISVLPPHVNHSGMLFLPEGEAIRAALPLVRDLGIRGTHAILDARQSGRFASLHDFCSRVGRSVLRRSAIANLIKSGALNGLGLNRRQALASLDHVLKWTDRQPGQLSLWEWFAGDHAAPELPDFTPAEEAAAEAEILGMILSMHPLGRYAAALAPAPRVTLSALAAMEPGRDVTVAAAVMARSRRRLKKGGVMLTMFISDESGFAEAVLYPSVYKRLLYRLDGNLFLLTGKTAPDGEAVIVEDALPLAMPAGAQEGKRSSASNNG